MAAEVARLQEEVSENTSVVDSAIVALSGLANRLREALLAEDSLEQVSALADELDANSQRLAVAIAANTLSENDSEEFDASEVEAEEEVESNNGEDDPDIILGEPVDGVDTSTEEAPSLASDDTVSAVDVAIESAGDANDPADDGEEPTNSPSV